MAEHPGELRLSDAEAERLTVAWNDGEEGGPLTLAAALYALHIANDVIEWNHHVAKMIVTTALRRARSEAPAAPVPDGQTGGLDALSEVDARIRLFAEFAGQPQQLARAKCEGCFGTGQCYHCYHTEDGEPCCLCDEQGAPNVCYFCKGTGLAAAERGTK